MIFRKTTNIRPSDTGSLVANLKARGLVEHASADLGLILGTPRTVYVGVDPTADSMHVGHLAWILLMKRLGEMGHKLIFLVGGGTGAIGDPKEKGERVLLDEKTVAANTLALKRQLKNILGRTPFTLVDNADWLDKLKLIPFLRDIGKHFTINDLTKREVIRRRLDAPDESISFTEFSYSLLQAYDYLVLNQRYGADLQVGASDQWTNILSGVDLIRKKEGKEVYAFTIPLVTDSAGKKFGKSEGNAVWLDAEKTSPFRFYQFWINLPDDKIGDYLNIYTSLSPQEIETVMVKHRETPQDREAQELLARLVTETVHGPAATAQAAAATDALFGHTPFGDLSREARQVALAEAPSVTLSRHEVEPGVPLAEVLVQGGMATSKGDARRLIEGKGIVLGDMRLENPDQTVNLGDFKDGYALVRKGKQGVLVLVLK